MSYFILWNKVRHGYVFKINLDPNLDLKERADLFLGVFHFCSVVESFQMEESVDEKEGDKIRIGAVKKFALRAGFFEVEKDLSLVLIQRE